MMTTVITIFTLFHIIIIITMVVSLGQFDFMHRKFSNFRPHKLQSDSIITRFKHCAIKKLNLSSLEGDWKLAYYMDPLMHGYSVNLILKSRDGGTTLVGTMTVNGHIHQINLKRANDDIDGVLINELSPQHTNNTDDGHGGSKVPVVIIAAEPSKYFVSWQGGKDGLKRQDWAIYQRSNLTVLAKGEIEQATAGLKCLEMANKYGAIMIYAVT